MPPSQAELFRDALVRKGIPTRTARTKVSRTASGKAETIIDAQQAALSFYGQVLGFDPPGVPTLELWRASA